MDNFDAIYDTVVGTANAGSEVPGVESINYPGSPYWQAYSDLLTAGKRLMARHGLEFSELFEEAEMGTILLSLDTMQREAALEMYRYGRQYRQKRKK